MRRIKLKKLRHPFFNQRREIYVVKREYYGLSPQVKNNELETMFENAKKEAYRLQHFGRVVRVKIQIKEL